MRSYAPAAPNGFPPITSVRDVISTRVTRALSGEPSHKRVAVNQNTVTNRPKRMRRRIAQGPRRLTSLDFLRGGNHPCAIRTMGGRKQLATRVKKSTERHF